MNGIQDCRAFENGTVSCETGVDCGGPCRSCDSCFNGHMDWTETGIDCGGLYCAPCKVKPRLEFPKIICEKSIDPRTNDGAWFFLLLFVFVIARIGFYVRRMRQLKPREKEPTIEEQIKNELNPGSEKLKVEEKARTDEAEYRRARNRYAERNKMALFILIAIAIALLSYLFYYEFLLCRALYKEVWWLGLLLLLVPFLIYETTKWLTYDERRKLRKYGALQSEHEEAMQRMLAFENRQIVEVEQKVAQLIEKVAHDERLREEMPPDLKQVYKDIITLFDEYKKNKSPTGIERSLCEKVYALETSEFFRALAAASPDFWLLYEQLKLLYQHYESKQQLYVQIEQERSRIKQHLESTVIEAPQEKEERGYEDARQNEGMKK